MVTAYADEEEEEEVYEKPMEEEEEVVVYEKTMQQIVMTMTSRRLKDPFETNNTTIQNYASTISAIYFVRQYSPYTRMRLIHDDRVSSQRYHPEAKVV
jgi:hypothetical protein